MLIIFNKEIEAINRLYNKEYNSTQERDELRKVIDDYERTTKTNTAILQYITETKNKMFFWNLYEKTGNCYGRFE